MTLEELDRSIEQARASGVSLWVEAGRLHFRATEGPIANELRAWLQANKEALVAALGRPVIMPLGRVDRVHLLPSMLKSWREAQTGSAGIASTNGSHFVARWPKSLDLPSLQKSVDGLIERHPVLGARLVEASGIPELSFHPPRQCVIENVGLPNGCTNQEEALRAAVGEQVWTPFSTAGSLFRVFVAGVSDLDRVVGFVIHGLIADWWSTRLVWSELVQGYEHQRVAADAPRPCAVQYSDYLTAMRAWLGSPGAQYCRSYWQRVMAFAPRTCLPPEGDLPVDAVRPLECASFNIPAPALDGWRDWGGRGGPGIFAVVVAAKAVALAASSGATDLVFRVSVSGRDDDQLLRTVGNTAGFIALRLSFTMQMRFWELVTQVRLATAAAYAHRLPSGSLEAVLSEAGAADVFPRVNFMSTSAASAESPDIMLPLRLVPPRGSRLASHELRIFHDRTVLRGGVLYQSQRYARPTIAALVTLFCRTVDLGVKSPTQTLAGLIQTARSSSPGMKCPIEDPAERVRKSPIVDIAIPR